MPRKHAHLTTNPYMMNMGLENNMYAAAKISRRKSFSTNNVTAYFGYGNDR